MYHPTCRELTFSNAGMPYPLRASHAGCQQLKEGGLPSGMFPNTCYDIHRVSLAPGDSVLFATDGLHELRGVSGDDLVGREWEKSGDNAAKRPRTNLDNVFFTEQRILPWMEFSMTTLLRLR